MSVFKVLGGIVCLSVFVGTGALADMGGSNAAEAINMLEKQGEAKSPHRNAAKAVKKLKHQGEAKRPHSDAAKAIHDLKQQDNAKMVAIGGEAMPVEDLAQQTRKGGSRYFN